MYLYSAARVLINLFGLQADGKDFSPITIFFILIQWVLLQSIAAYRLLKDKRAGAWLASMTVSIIVLMLFIPALASNRLKWERATIEIVSLHIFGTLGSLFFYSREKKQTH